MHQILWKATSSLSSLQLSQIFLSGSYISIKKPTFLIAAVEFYFVYVGRSTMRSAENRWIDIICVGHDVFEDTDTFLQNTSLKSTHP